MDFILLSILAISSIFAIVATHKTAAPIDYRINFASWNIIVEFILTGVLGVFTIESVNLKTNWIFRNIPNSEFPKLEVIYTLIWCCFAIPLGFLLANITLKKLKLEINYKDYIKSPLTKSLSKHTELFILFIYIAYTAYVISTIGYIPQIKALQLTFDEAAYLRGQLTHSFPSSIYLKEFIGLRLIPIFSYYYYSKFINNINCRNFILFLILASLAIFFSTINFNKSGVAFYFIGIIITHGITSKGYNLKKFILILVSIMSLTILSFSIIKRNYNPLEMIKSVHKRVIYAQSYANYYSFYLYPNKLDHIGFKSLTSFRSTLGLEYKLPASRQMMREALPKQFKDKRAGYLTSHFFAEAWANFGFIGVILSPLYVGFIMKFLIGILVNIPKSHLTVAILAFTSFNFKISSSFNTILLPRYIIATFIFFFICYKIDRRYLN